MLQPDIELAGPEQVSAEDIGALNRLFAEAFTDRYHRDGMTGVRVPFLNAEVWRYAIEDAGEGAMLWRDDGGRLAAFNLVHQSGTEGWMGPLAVRPALQGSGVGSRVVEAGITWLERHGAAVIGLETMPRTVENIGFYSRLGFRPGHLTISLAKELDRTGAPEARGVRIPGDGGREHNRLVEGCRGLTDRLASGVDFTRQIRLTDELGLGGTTVLPGAAGPRGFAVWHQAALAHGRVADEIRVLKIVAEDLGAFTELIGSLEDQASALAGVNRVSLRCQTEYGEAYAFLVGAGYRVQWTDLRMTLASATPPGRAGIVMSNWEI
ncbi:MAG TPA: GNAT family N-acetyltransferase [Gemmatimonadales bacterium]|nr:GNAT family N-acetyltransferase [Gemmatimonadales bacterium]